MSKKFITVEGTRVMLTHYMPFDPVNGMGKSEAELLEIGYLVDEVLEPEIMEGKIAEAHYTPETGFYYEYEDAPAGSATTADIAALSAKIDYVGMMTEVM